MRTNSYDEHSQLDYILFLTDRNTTCQPPASSSYKSEKTAGSVLGIETIAFADTTDIAYFRNHDLKETIKCKLSVIMIMDSLSSFGVNTSASKAVKKNPLVHMITVNDFYRREELKIVLLVRTVVYSTHLTLCCSKTLCPVLTQVSSAEKVAQPVEQ